MNIDETKIEEAITEKTNPFDKRVAKAVAEAVAKAARDTGVARI